MENEHDNEKESESPIDPYSLFIYSMRSPLTRRKYEGRLRIFFDFIGIPQGSIQERCNIFAKGGKSDTNWAFNHIFKFLQMLKDKAEQKEMSGATVRNYVKTIKLLCETSEILIAWKKITRGLPKGRRFANDRAPTLEEIKKLCEYPDRRIKPIICTMVSSGIRLGAWDSLRWGHITPLIKDGNIVAAKVIVYAEDEEECYTFITPEAYTSLEEWMVYRKECGETITKDSWVMRNLWDVTKPMGKGIVTVPKKLKSTGIKRLIERALWAQGVRKKLIAGKKRHEFQADHGFRKYFKTTCENAKMQSINIETLMGHSTGISDSYYRATESQLLQNYLIAVESLSINEENRMQKHEKEDKLKVVTEQLNTLQSQMQAMVATIGNMDGSNRNTFAKQLFDSHIFHKD